MRSFSHPDLCFLFVALPPLLRPHVMIRPWLVLKVSVNPQFDLYCHDGFSILPRTITPSLHGWVLHHQISSHLYSRIKDKRKGYALLLFISTLDVVLARVFT